MSSVYAQLDQDIGHDASQALQDEAEATSMILVLGETGAGKSHFINAIAPGTCETSPRLSSCKSPRAATKFSLTRIRYIQTERGRGQVRWKAAHSHRYTGFQ